VEIREHVGAENFFLFGLTAPEVQELKARGYRPRDYYDANPQLKVTLDLIASGFFSPGNPGLFRPLVDHLLHHDTYLLLADYAAYVECQEKVSQAYRDVENWSRKSILNVARAGYFSSDRSIREYCERIWRAEPVPIDLAAEPPG
ncbi:MAG: glycogen/starch/alpha-glucan phosphorylase, partial [Verrucomicrobia bacterium]|nr:glycogen/starch/alpha-glucan phosphorylase [Verrucomicrobiota bacterium]